MGEETTFIVVDLGPPMATVFLWRRGPRAYGKPDIEVIQRLESENEGRYTGAFPR